MADVRHDMLLAALDKYGADVSRWPEAMQVSAREALLSDVAFRRAWEVERDLDRVLLADRDAIDADVKRAGAAALIRSRLLARIAPDPLASLPWRSIAAAVLLAGMLGSALDLALPEPAAETADVAMLDPLEAVDGAGAP
jgi:hypothetical protein